MNINTVKASFAKMVETPATNPTKEAQVQTLFDELTEKKGLLEQKLDSYTTLSVDKAEQVQMLIDEIDAMLSMLDTFLKTGIMNIVGGDVSDIFADLPDLPEGWYAEDGTWTNATDNKAFPDYDKYNDKTGDIPGAGEFAGVILVEKSKNTGAATDIGNGLCFTMTDDMEKIETRTVGNDVWVTVTYKDGDKKKTWVVKDLAIRGDINFYINAMNCEEVKTIDNSQLIRVNVEADNFGTPAEGVIVIGGQADDLILGSQSNDTIFGWDGKDHIFGLGGEDKIFGDRGYIGSNGLGVSDDVAGDNDYIDGGDGADFIYAGGGTYDEVVNDFSDTIDEEEHLIDVKGTLNAEDAAKFVANINDDTYSETSNWEAKLNEAGEIEVTKLGTEEGNVVEIKMPAGYSIATSDQENTDLILTLTKIDPISGEPVQIKVRIKGVLSNGEQTTIKIKADSKTSTIIDMHTIKGGGNIFELIGSPEKDVLYGPQTNIDDLHLDYKTVMEDKNSTMTSSEIAAIITGKKPDGGTDGQIVWGSAKWDAKKQENSGGDYINLTLTSEAVPVSPNFEAPEGFTVDGVYYKTADDGSLWIYAVDVKADGTIEVLKIRIDKDSAKKIDMSGLKVGGMTAQPMGYTSYVGGEGEDMIIASRGSTASTDAGEEDQLEQGWYTKEYVSKSNPATAQATLFDVYSKYDKQECPPALVGDPAFDEDGKPVMGADGKQVKYDDKDKDGNTVWYCLYHGDAPNFETTPATTPPATNP